MSKNKGSLMQEMELKAYAQKALRLFHDGNDHARASRDAAHAVGAKACRMGWSEEDLRSWSQSHYSQWCVHFKNWDCGLDHRAVQDALVAGFNTTKKNDIVKRKMELETKKVVDG